MTNTITINFMSELRGYFWSSRYIDNENTIYSELAKTSKTIENSNSNQLSQQYLRCNYTKFQLKISIVFICA